MSCSDMVDGPQVETSEVSRHLAYAGSQRSMRDFDSNMESDAMNEDEDNQEDVWFQSVQTAGADELATPTALQSHSLTLDFSSRKDELAPSPAKRGLKAQKAS